ncbi:MAG: ABC transporter permease, partial [Lacisediminihabitans sp.]
EQPGVYAASPGIIHTAGASMVSGRMFDSGHDRRAARVAVISARAAKRLGVGAIGSQPSVFLGGMAYAVIGIYDHAKYDGDLQDAIIIPSNTARTEFDLASPDEVMARLAVNTGPIFTKQAPIALSPNSPDEITVSAPGGVSGLQKSVQGDVNLVFVILSIVVLLAGGFGIANVTMLSVMERTAEIGLRRAVGATARQIAAQFVVESVILGLLGGLLGAAVGVVSIEVFALVHHWTVVTSIPVALGGVALGALVGLVAGGLPARRAARIEPVDALRG